VSGSGALTYHSLSVSQKHLC